MLQEGQIYVPRSRYRTRAFSPKGYAILFGAGVLIGPPILMGFIYGVFWSWQAAGKLLGL